MSEARREIEAPPELESQLIMRLPEEPAKVMRELLQSGANLRDRCTIRLDNDMRYGEVRVDNWLLHAKIVDIPTIMESLKTIDNKSFYKTADICQMMICKEEPDQPVVEEENPTKNKKKDQFKVEKKFLWPHGITPPAKNVRKRRFRKTLRKKYAEAPEVEKEVKRLLRSDNDAVSVKWEIISEEDEPKKADKAGRSASDKTGTKVKKEKVVKIKQEPKAIKRERGSKAANPNNASGADTEHDIFGGAVSDDSDGELGSNVNNSQLSEYDNSHLSDSNSVQDSSLLGNKDDFPNQFAPDMFHGDVDTKWNSSLQNLNKPTPVHPVDVDEYNDQPLNKETIQLQMDQLGTELASLRLQRAKKEQEVASMENLALRQRFQDILDNLEQDILFKEMEYQGLQEMLQEAP